MSGHDGVLVLLFEPGKTPRTCPLGEADRLIDAETMHTIQGAFGPIRLTICGSDVDPTTGAYPTPCRVLSSGTVLSGAFYVYRTTPTPWKDHDAAVDVVPSDVRTLTRMLRVPPPGTVRDGPYDSLEEADAAARQRGSPTLVQHGRTAGYWLRPASRPIPLGLIGEVAR